jgi:precorrin-6B methylase 2
MQLFSLIFLVLLNLVALTIVSYIFFAFIYPLFAGGAPYAPSEKLVIQTAVRLAKLCENDLVADLGSGDGRVLIEAAKTGAAAYGFEISPVLCIISKFKIRKARLNDKIKVFKKSFWDADLSSYTVVFIYQLPFVVKKIEEKLVREMRPGARIICNGFKLPTLQSQLDENGVYLYNMPALSEVAGQKPS